ncbi:uncharacterized protein LOC143927673 isoform X2 [Lithobates pipiens]
MAPQILWRPGSSLQGAAAGQAGGESVFGPWRVNRERLTRSILRGAGSPGPQPGGGSALRQARVHPGIIIAVVVVALLALLAAIFIVKKYCFPESNATYRYSELRTQQEELDNSTTNRLQDDSDEDLLD